MLKTLKGKRRKNHKEGEKTPMVALLEELRYINK
jgi:hypothetical protein